jgi:hypothetical protein
LNKTQTKKVFDECIESVKEKFDEIRKFVYDDSHNWLFVNLPSQRIFKGFDEIIYNNENNDD